MAKERMVNTKFWDDTYISKLTKEEKLAFIYLLTNPLTNIAGVYEIQDRRIIFDTGLTDIELTAIKKKFDRDNKIIFENGWVAIVNFIRHQKANPKVYKGILLALEGVPTTLIDRLSIDYDRLSHFNSTAYLNSTTNSNLNAQKSAGGKKEVKPKKVVKKEEDNLPSWLDRKKWAEWIAYRKARRLTITEATITRQIAQLEKFKDQHVAMIEQSIKNGWQGIFELKGGVVTKPSNVLNKTSDEIASKLERKANQNK